MSIQFQCPVCHEPLSSDSLVCHTHGEFKRSPQGFISFSPQQDCYFSEHWSLSALPELPSAKIAAASDFLAPLLVRPSGTWLDVGTGDGIHLSVLRTQCKDTQLIGLDISSAALAICHKRIPGATLMLADAQAIPICSETLDGAFSYGVLAYVPDTWKALAEMVRVTRKGGLIGVWMYPRTTSFMGLIFATVRQFVPRLPRFMQARVADCIVPFLGLLPTAGRVHLGNASWAACREVVMVNIAPPHLIFPTADEVRRQLQGLGCRIVIEDDFRHITLWAVKE